MIPAIQNLPKVESLYQDYLKRLSNSDFSGDIEHGYAQRLLAATDNSVYQCMPNAVIFPKSTKDISIALKLRNSPEFSRLIITPRGGGTGTNGQSLNKGISIDCSRYMKQVLKLDVPAHEVTVQAGVIKDELNELIRPHGMFFSPELSTSSRATVGGMVSNDAAGQGSLHYGRTSSHVKAVKVVLTDGSICEFGPLSGEQLKQALVREGLEGEIYRHCYSLLKDNHDKVVAQFPRLNRFMTGYDLYHSYDKKNDCLNLARLICGAEGTLAVVSEVILDLTPIPTQRELLVISYQDFESALRHATELVQAGALSVETVDSKVLGLAKQDVVWNSVRDYIFESAKTAVLGLNIVEFAGDDELRQHSLVQNLKDRLEQRITAAQGGILGFTQVSTAQGIAAVYGMRKKAVGLLGAAAGDAKLVPFTEDTVVPPEALADYILEFRALLDSMQVPYGMFGHVDTGLMHVRPALDLTQDSEQQKLITISNEVVKLVSKYGGQMWGEHGRGYRSCFGQSFFKDLYPIARSIKQIFDQDNILNPGKICVPLDNQTDVLVALDGPMRGDLDRLVPKPTRESFKGAFSCNGNGQCFSYQSSALMCPSYRYTKDHVRSPKGYSELMREWLRQLQQRDYSPLRDESIENFAFNPLTLMQRTYNTLFSQDDFSHEYLQMQKTCLSCKACKSICPAHVNAADLNSRFLALYYGRYLRPRLDLLVLNAERLVPLAAKVPRLANFLLRQNITTKINRWLFDMIDLPLFSDKTLAQLCNQTGIELCDVKQGQLSSCEIMLVADCFSASYDTQGLVDLALVIQALGYRVAILKPYINGKLYVIRGARAQFIKAASRQAQRLQALHSQGKILVGYDPALTICYRDEYQDLLGSLRGDFQVLLPEEFFHRALAQDQIKQKVALWHESLSQSVDKQFYLLAHCTEQAVLPQATQLWIEFYTAMGLRLKAIPVACCGMAGLHGHIAAYKQQTYQVYAQNWAGHIHSHPFDAILVTGFSCRSQVKRMEGKAVQHPCSALIKILLDKVPQFSEASS